jgi:hypothetical protein
MGYYIIKLKSRVLNVKCAALRTSPNYFCTKNGIYLF